LFLNWYCMASNTELKPGVTNTEYNETDLEEAQLYELRHLIKPLAALGKTLPAESKREMQKAVRALVEWALDVRAEEEFESPIQFQAHERNPIHRPGLSFINVAPSPDPGHQPGLRFTNIEKAKHLLINESNLRSGKMTAEEAAERRHLVPPNAGASASLNQPLGVSEHVLQINEPVVTWPCMGQYYASIEDVRASELEVENAALERKVFKLIETLSIENAKNRIRIENIQSGNSVTYLQNECSNYPSEEYGEYDDSLEEF